MWQSLLVASCIYCAIWLCSVEGLSPIGLKQIESGKRVFVEKDTGREVIFHGVNAIVKGIPYVPKTDSFDADISLSEEDHRLLSDLGVNIYRLGSMWAGVEPERGLYNDSYVGELNKIINSAEKYGIYTILDMHQDVFSEKYCGEGVPRWAAITDVASDNKNFPFPLSSSYVDVAQDGFPTRTDCAKFNWPQYYNTFAAGSGFQSLYQNKSGLLDSWANFWAYLASNIGKKNDAVIGYELINEPWGGDQLSNPALFIPGVADRTVLQPTYDVLAKAIRKEDAESLVIFAAVTWDDIVPVGFTAAPAGDSDKSVFAFHYYEPPQINKHSYFHQRDHDAQRLGTGTFLSEFERPQANDDLVNDPFVSQAEITDQYGLSWTMWEYKTFCKETEESLASDSQQASFGSCKTGYGERLLVDEYGKRIDNASRKLARTYAQAISGRFQSMKFNATSGDFVLRWTADVSIIAPSEVFAHQELNYPEGMTVSVIPKMALTWRMKSTNVVAFHYTDHVKSGDIISVFISRN